MKATNVYLIIAFLLAATITIAAIVRNSEKPKLQDAPQEYAKTDLDTENNPVEESSPKNYMVTLKTSEGNIVIELNKDSTPKTVSNFVELSKKGFYDNTIFHRVIDGFMIQGGDPTGTGAGDPGYKFDDEPFDGEYTRGTVAMANSGPNTNGSQFFIMHQDNPLPKNYVIFGKVIEGMDVVDKIATAQVTGNAMGENSKPVNPAKILSTEVKED